MSVFISFSHIDEDDDARILSLANQLRSDGVAASCYLFNPHPSQGWFKWMEDELRIAEKILIVGTDDYFSKFEDTSFRESGVRYEAEILRGRIYDSALDYSKIGLLKFDRFDNGKIPHLLRSCQRYVISDRESYLNLLRWLTNQPKNIPAPIGQVVKLAPTAVRPLFRSAGRIADFGELCAAIDPLLKENKRIFEAFGPNSGADAVGPLRRELSVWEDMKRNKILPNNLEIQRIIEDNLSMIPEDRRPMFDALRSHIDAFRVNCERGPIDYRNNLFPSEVGEVVDQNVKKEKRDN